MFLNTGSKWHHILSAFRIRSRIKPSVRYVVYLHRLVLRLRGINIDKLRAVLVNTKM